MSRAGILRRCDDIIAGARHEIGLREAFRTERRVHDYASLRTFDRRMTVALRDLRVNAGLTQAEIATLCGMGVKKYATFEHSIERAGRILTRDLLRILACYGVDPGEFFGMLGQQETR